MDNHSYDDSDGGGAYGCGVYVSAPGAVYQSGQKHDQKCVSDGAFTPANSIFAGCSLRDTSAVVDADSAASARDYAIRLWVCHLCQVCIAAARVQKI